MNGEVKHGYTMAEGNYIVNVKVIEAHDLIPHFEATYVNAFCTVSIRDSIKSTDVVKKTLSPLWDKNFNFELNNVTKGELEFLTLTFEVFDQRFPFMSHSIGKYEIDLSSVYFQKHHQYYMTWFTLFDPSNVKEGAVGYLQCNIDVLGPGDKPHINEKITEDSTKQTVISPKIKQQGHLIIAEVFKAEHLVPMNIMKRSLNAVVVINYGGIRESTRVVDDSNPIWNEMVYLRAMMPNHSKNIQIELWNQNSILDDDLIGTCLVPLNCFYTLTDLPPQWVSIYGPPLTSKGPKSMSMAEHGYRIGSCYRGRVLIRVYLVYSVFFQISPKSKEQNCSYDVQNT